MSDDISGGHTFWAVAGCRCIFISPAGTVSVQYPWTNISQWNGIGSHLAKLLRALGCTWRAHGSIVKAKWVSKRSVIYGKKRQEWGWCSYERYVVGDSHHPCGMAWISHASRQPCVSLWFLTLSSLRQFLTILVLLLCTLAPGIHKQW